LEYTEDSSAGIKENKFCLYGNADDEGGDDLKHKPIRICLVIRYLKYVNVLFSATYKRVGDLMLGRLRMMKLKMTVTMMMTMVM
jgi:hypothetical protein